MFPIVTILSLISIASPLLPPGIQMRGHVLYLMLYFFGFLNLDQIP